MYPQYTKLGYDVLQQDEQGVTLLKRRRPSVFLILAGVVTSCTGFGLAILLLAWLDWHWKKDAQIYLTFTQIAAGVVPERGPADTRPLVLALAVVLTIAGAMVLMNMVQQS